jgi:hypothetical protein
VLGKAACEWGKRNRGKLSTRKFWQALARQLRAGLGPRGGGGAVMARQVGRRSCQAKAATGCDELGGATHGELPSSIGGRGRSNAAQI